MLRSMAEFLHSRSFTYDDYLLLPEDSPRCELIEGEFLMTPAPTVTHQTLLGRLFATIFNFLDPSPMPGLAIELAGLFRDVSPSGVMF